MTKKHKPLKPRSSNLKIAISFTLLLLVATQTLTQTKPKVKSHPGVITLKDLSKDITPGKDHKDFQTTGDDVPTAGRGRWTEATKPVNWEITATRFRWDQIGAFLGVCFRLVQFGCTIAMFADVFSRYVGKPLKVMSIYRYVLVSYGAVLPGYIGMGLKRPLVYRGIIGLFLEEWYKQFYNGWFNIGFVNIFSAPDDANGVEYPDFIHYCNVLFFELIIYLILLILAAATEHLLKKRNRLAHLFASLKLVYVLNFMFPFVMWAVKFLVQAERIYGLNRKTERYGVWTFSYLVGYGVALMMLFQVAYTIFSMVYAVYKFGVELGSGIPRFVCFQPRRNPLRPKRTARDPNVVNNVNGARGRSQLPPLNGVNNTGVRPSQFPGKF